MKTLALAAAAALTLRGAAARAADITYDVNATFVANSAASVLGTITGTLTLDPSKGLFTEADLTASGFKMSNGSYTVIAIQGPDFLSGTDLDVVPPGYGPELEFVFAPDSLVNYSATAIGVNSLYYNSGNVFDNGYSTTATVTEQPLSISAAPEPSTWALMIVGIAGLGMALRKAKATTRRRPPALVAA